MPAPRFLFSNGTFWLLLKKTKQNKKTRGQCCGILGKACLPHPIREAVQDLMLVQLPISVPWKAAKMAKVLKPQHPHGESEETPGSSL